MGKSLIVSRLLNGNQIPEDFEGLTTPGIDIHDKFFNLSDGRRVKVNFWDFGGQEILHSMHRMFMTERTLYVLVLDARKLKDDSKESDVRRWLRNIKTFAGDCPLMIVINKVDLYDGAEVSQYDLRKIYPELRKVVHLSALTDAQRIFEKMFTEPLLDLIGSFETLGKYIPASWHRFRVYLRERKEEKQYKLSGRMFKQACEDCGVLEAERKKMLTQLCDLGVCYSYEEYLSWEEYVLLNPEWITNAVYCILWNGEKQNGVVRTDDMGALLAAVQQANGEGHIKVCKEFEYFPSDLNYALRVFRKFKLSFCLVPDKEEFIPSLCRRSAPDADMERYDAEYINNPNVLEFRLRYENLPNNALYQLMVTMQNNLDRENVWASGAIFKKNRGCGCCASALVKIVDDELCIYIKGSVACPARQYLEDILDELDNIRQELNLVRIERNVAYKVVRDGTLDVEYINYDTILLEEEMGEDTHLSTMLRKRVPIKRILKQMDSGMTVEQIDLLNGIMTACLDMQKNSHYWHPRADKGKPRENKRNTYLRNTLHHMNYDADDQTLRGTGATGAQEGELDVMVRDGGEDWAICEGVNITGTDKANWNKHLKKLLDNYNPMGLEMLVMIDYVECTKDEFLPWWGSYDKHMRKYAPDGYSFCEGSYDLIDLQKHKTDYFRLVRTTYERAGVESTVYHFFVRVHGDDSK